MSKYLVDLIDDIKLYQDSELYSFTQDAVLLANSVKNVSNKVVVDMCSGNGVISTLLAYKSKPKLVYAIELQQPLCEIFNESIILNNQQDIIKIININLLNSSQILGKEIADCVVCNPPYRKVGSGQTQLNQVQAICRHEIMTTLNDCISQASKLLKYRGSFYIVHQFERLAEIIYLCKQSNIEAKELTLIHARQDETPKQVIVKGIKNGSVGLICNKSIIVYDNNGNYTQTIKDLYSK